MDHIKQGKALNHFVYPAQIPVDEYTQIFADGLKEIIPKELKVLHTRLEYLKKRRSLRLNKVRGLTKRSSVEEYFWTLFAEDEFSEAYVIAKWLRYWVTLKERVSDKPELVRDGNKFDDLDKEKANGYFLENLYEGQLRKSGSKLVGVCPFHSEQTASFFVFPDNHYHCYGCGEHGDAISFVMKLKGYSFPEAVRYLT